MRESACVCVCERDREGMRTKGKGKGNFAGAVASFSAAIQKSGENYLFYLYRGLFSFSSSV